MHKRAEKCIQNLSENLKGRDHLGDLGADRRIKLKLVPNRPYPEPDEFSTDSHIIFP
jgi:hypothetical protein